MISKLIVGLRDLVTSDQTAAPCRGEFVKGVNFGGDTIVIQGNTWESYDRALANGLSTPGAAAATTSVQPYPYASKNIRKMLNSVIYKPQTLEINQTLPNGSYELYLWIMENFKSDWHSLELCLEGRSIANEIGKLPFSHWAKVGPYATAVTDESLHMTISTNNPTVDAHIMGMSIFAVGT